MAGSIVEAMANLAQTLRAGGVEATHDPGRAASSRPCVLVAPPSMDYSALANTWRLVALASKPAGTLEAVAELDELVALVVELLPVEAADPASYALTPETGTVPAYVLRLTT